MFDIVKPINFNQCYTDLACCFYIFIGLYICNNNKEQETINFLKSSANYKENLIIACTLLIKLSWMIQINSNINNKPKYKKQ